jgi:hypothetical protein
MAFAALNRSTSFLILMATYIRATSSVMPLDVARLDNKRVEVCCREEAVGGNDDEEEVSDVPEFE